MSGDRQAVVRSHAGGRQARTRARGLPLAAVMLVSGSGVVAAPTCSQSLMRDAGVERLQAAYRLCDEQTASSAAAAVTLGPMCGCIAEALLEQGFQGDLDAMLRWRNGPARAPAAAASGPEAERRALLQLLPGR